MSVDPQIKALLARIYEHMDRLNHPPLHRLTPEKSRFYFQEGRKFFTQKPVEGVEKREDRIVRPGSLLPVRLYRSSFEQRLPVLVYFHGGGWVLGDLDSSDEVCARLALDAKALVISVDYRLAPEHKYPAPLLDAVDAVLWALGHAEQWGGDRRRVSVGGESAGANLAAAAAIRVKEMGLSLESQLLITPVTNYAFDTPSYQERGYMNLTKERMMWFWNHYLEQPAQGLEHYASPLLNRDCTDLPKSLILTAEWDPLRDEGRAYAERLSRHGVEVTYRCFPGMVHSFIHMIHDAPAAKCAFQEGMDLYRKLLQAAVTV